MTDSEILILIAVVISLFVLWNSSRLDSEQIDKLASIRRSRAIRQYYRFDNSEYLANKEFKKKMAPNGSYYKADWDLDETPSQAAALLKSKKHEWIIIAFVEQQITKMIWLNKGINRSSVGLILFDSELEANAKNWNCDSIIIFHNHPASNSDYRYNLASDQDFESASKFASIFNPINVTLVEFVCARGRHYEYFLSAAGSLLKMSKFVDEIVEVNGSAWVSNFSLRMELLFRKKEPGISMP